VPTFIDNDLAQPWTRGLFEGNIIVRYLVDVVLAPSFSSQGMLFFEVVVHYRSRTRDSRSLPWLVDTMVAS
jgi:hypothetical protein